MSKLVSLALVALVAVSAVSGLPIGIRPPPATVSPLVDVRPPPTPNQIAPVIPGDSGLQNRAAPASSPSPSNPSQPASSPAPGDDDDDDDDCEEYEDDEEENDNDNVNLAVNSPVPGTPTPKSTSTPGSPEASPTPVGNTPSDTHTDGHVTWFTQNGNYGACGIKHSDDDLIAALDYRAYGNLSAKSKYCGQKIRVSWQGKSVDVTVADACPTCFNSASVDLSVAAFKALAPLDVGELTGVTWQAL